MWIKILISGYSHLEEFVILYHTDFFLLIEVNWKKATNPLVILLLIKIKVALQQKVFNMELLVYIHVDLHTYTLGEALVPFLSTSPGSMDFTVKVALILHLALYFP